MPGRCIGVARGWGRGGSRRAVNFPFFTTGFTHPRSRGHLWSMRAICAFSSFLSPSDLNPCHLLLRPRAAPALPLPVPLPLHLLLLLSRQRTAEPCRTVVKLAGVLALFVLPTGE
jgi:hypothetical protein